MKNLSITLPLGLAAWLLASLSLANSGGNAPAEGINYIAVSPPLVVNYGGSGPRSRYIRAELSIRTENAADAAEVMHHLPLVRDKLISLLSAQTEAQVASPEGKEALRLRALAEINQAIHQVEFGVQVEHSSATAATKHGQTEGHVDKGPEAHADQGSGAHADKGPQAHGEQGAAEEHPGGPASDLFFNNFVVQK